VDPGIREATVLSLLVEVKNMASDRLTNLEAYFGTRDDWIGTSDRPTKSPAFVSSDGVDLTVSGGNAVMTKSGQAAVIIYSPDASARGLYSRCCSFQNVLDIPNPESFTGPATTDDGSYGVYNNIGGLDSMETATLFYFYGVGEPTPIGLNAIAQQSTVVAEAAVAANPPVCRIGCVEA